MNDPSREFYKCYEIDFDRHRYDGRNWTYINLPVEEIKQMAITSIKDSTMMYFSCDVGKFLNSERVARWRTMTMLHWWVPDFAMNRSNAYRRLPAGHLTPWRWWLWHRQTGNPKSGWWKTAGELLMVIRDISLWPMSGLMNTCFAWLLRKNMFLPRCSMCWNRNLYACRHGTQCLLRNSKKGDNRYLLIGLYWRFIEFKAY